MSKVLIFTHKNDIDGMGSVVLAKLAFDNVDYVMCATFELQKQLSRFVISGEIYNYDKIFVTDLWLEEPMFSEIALNERLVSKFYIFDHHKSSLVHKHIAPFNIVLKISDENGLCCGTSLFYDFLTDNGLLKASSIYSEFSELTRRHDTWEWKTKYNDEKARELALLFDVLGPKGYIELMCNKLAENNAESTIEFDKFERMLIENRKNMTEEKVKAYAQNLYYKEIMGLKAGIAFINYEYRNELAEYLRENNFDIDFVMMITLDYGTISYRSVKDGVNVREVAVAMGGKGHDKAATNPITKEKQIEIIELLMGN